MAKTRLDWYQHLVDQSCTDRIYDLIHENISFRWELNHDLDFVVIKKNNLPKKYGGILPYQHIAKSLNQSEYCFQADDYILLDNFCLTEYLTLATKMQTIVDKKNRKFIELAFDPYREETDNKLNESGELEINILSILNINPDTISNKEHALFFAYELLKKGKEPKLALRFAKIGESFLDTIPILINENVDDGLNEIKKLMLGYNIVAMVYTWNNEFDDAAIVDDYYIKHPNIWGILGDYLNTYLEMLMAKKRVTYLNYLFKDLDFKNKFLAHYEAYISLFINPKFQLTKMSEVFSIINRVNNCQNDYL